MAGYLEYGVGGGINDGVSRLYMLVAQLVYYYGSRSGVVAYGFASDGSLDLIHYLLGESRFGKCGEGVFRNDSGDLPVPRCSVLAV